MNELASSPRWSLTKSDLAHFTGTTSWYTTPLSRQITYTDGVQHVAEHGGAVWLVTDIIAAQHIPKVVKQPFQVWTLKVNPDRSAQLICEDGNGNLVHEQKYRSTDFPLDEITMWMTDNTILLPSEY